MTNKSENELTAEEIARFHETGWLTRKNCLAMTRLIECVIVSIALSRWREACRRVLINGYAYPGANGRIYPGEGAGRTLTAG